MTRKLRFLAPLLVCAACGGDGPSTDPVDQETASDYCQLDCEHQEECDPLTDVNLCVADCVDDTTGVIREDVMIGFVDCVVALDCGASEDVCFDQNCSPTAVHVDYETDCRDRLAQCSLTADQINGVCETDPAEGTGDAGYLCAIAPSIMSELDACFDEADCVAVSSCLQEVIASYGIGG